MIEGEKSREILTFIFMKVVIDMGSQSLRSFTFSSKKDFLEGKIRSEICPLAKDLEGGFLKESRKEEALILLEDFIKGFAAEDVHLYATSAIREAKDGQAFIDEIKERFKIQAEIISGEEEANLGYEGVKLLAGTSPFSLLDLGGGSTEIVTPHIKKSYPMGVVRYFEKIDLGEYYRNLPQIQGKLYAIGGSLSVFVSLSLGSRTYNRERIHGKTIKRSQIKEITNNLAKMSIEERKSHLGTFSKRVYTIIPAGIILDYLLEKLDQKELIYSDFTAIEGYALSRKLI